jgi:hypothetical protein
MLLCKALLGLATSGGVTGLAPVPDLTPGILARSHGNSPLGDRSDPTGWSGLMTGLCEVLLEHLTIPLGTVTPYQCDIHLKG